MASSIMLLNQKVKIFLFFLSLLCLFPLIGQTAGLVPCGGEGEPACEFCHLFVLFNNLVEFTLTKIVPPVAVLMFVISGLAFFTAMGSPDKVIRAKNILLWTVVGVFVIYAAYLIVGAFLTAIGVAEWTGLTSWFEFPCP